MRREVSFWIGVVAALVAQGCSFPEVRWPTAPDPAAESVGETPKEAQVAEVHRLLNQRRIAAGCPTLSWSPDLANVAAAHSDDMRERDFFAHETPEGIGVGERIRRAGLRWQRTIGENLAQTSRGPEDVVRLWIESPAHRANVENCAFRVHGLGRSEDYWTQILAGGVERM